MSLIAVVVFVAGVVLIAAVLWLCVRERPDQSPAGRRIKGVTAMRADPDLSGNVLERSLRPKPRPPIKRRPPMVSQ